MLLPTHFVPLWAAPPSTTTGDPGSGGFWFIFQDEKLLVQDRSGGAVTVPNAASATDLPLSATETHCMRGLLGRLPDAWLAVAGRACQVVEFHRTHRFCGATAWV